MPWEIDPSNMAWLLLQKKSPHLYVAAPYTNPDPVFNTHRTIKTADTIYTHTRFVPVIPHLTMLWHMVTPHPESYWYYLDLLHMSRCSHFLRLPGESHGADYEQSVAEKLGIWVVTLDELPDIVRETWADTPY